MYIYIRIFVCHFVYLWFLFVPLLKVICMEICKEGQKTLQILSTFVFFGDVKCWRECSLLQECSKPWESCTGYRVECTTWFEK